MLAVIVVGYNSKHDLDTCFQSVFASSFKDFRLVFVDNASSDGSVSHVRKHYPQVEIIQLETNIGFAGANNCGVARAKELGAQAVFFLNPDTYLDQDCLKTLVSYHSPREVLQPVVLIRKEEKNTDVINTTGGELHYLGFSYCSHYKEQHTKSRKYKAQATGSGAALYVPFEVIDNAGSFDDLFFLYYEDADMTWRFRLYGIAITIVPDARVWHAYHFSRSLAKTYYIERNRYIFLLKNYATKTLCLMLPFFLLTELGLLFYHAKSGTLGYKIKAITFVITHRRDIVRARKAVQTHRVRSDAELKDFWAQDLHFDEVRVPLESFYNFVSRRYWWLIRKFI